MCLAIPGEILSIENATGLMRTGRVSFGGIVKEINLSYTPAAGIGDYVLVHVGFAISQIDADVADKIIQELEKLEEIDPEIYRTLT